jgi:hypothetical protein
MRHTGELCIVRNRCHKVTQWAVLCIISSPIWLACLVNFLPSFLCNVIFRTFHPQSHWVLCFLCLNKQNGLPHHCFVWCSLWCCMTQCSTRKYVSLWVNLSRHDCRESLCCAGRVGKHMCHSTRHTTWTSIHFICGKVDLFKISVPVLSQH